MEREGVSFRQKLRAAAGGILHIVASWMHDFGLIPEILRGTEGEMVDKEGQVIAKGFIIRSPLGGQAILTEQDEMFLLNPQRGDTIRLLSKNNPTEK